MKLIVLKSRKEHFWGSCVHIYDAWNEGLEKLNEADIDLIEFFENDGFSQEQLEFLSKHERESVLFLKIDHLKMQNILQQLSHLKELRIILPVIGNLTIELDRWKSLDSIIKGMKVCFLSASFRQSLQSEVLLNGFVKRLPYPIKDSGFSLNCKNEVDNEKVRIVYAGRLTPQKNILSLLNSFTLARRINPKLELKICGNFHDRDYHLHHINLSSNYRDTVLKTLESCKDVTYLGNLNQDGLLDLFRSSDYQVCVGTHHDEDFGYSIAQGLALGLDPILTDWGGLYDHSLISSVKMIPVDLKDENIPFPRKASLVKAFIALTQKAKFEEKTKLSHKTRESYSTMLWAKSFKKLIKIDFPRFQGITPLFQEYLSKAYESYPFKKETGIYEKIYNSYLFGRDEERFKL